MIGLHIHGGTLGYAPFWVRYTSCSQAREVVESEARNEDSSERLWQTKGGVEASDLFFWVVVGA